MATNLNINFIEIMGLELARRAYIRIFHPESIFLINEKIDQDNVDLIGQDASDYIEKKLSDNTPCMIARLGAIELRCLCSYLYFIKNPPLSFFSRATEYIQCKTPPFWWWDLSIKEMSNNTGFFPVNIENFGQYFALITEDMRLVDILGSCQDTEMVFKENLKTAVRIRLVDLEPYYHSEPWTKALKGKTILVIHPFSESITRQYQKRELLFNNPNILPEFNLKTIQAIQSIAGSNVQYKDWFEALEYMKNQINLIDFDIAIIGCGAYGFPLAAHIKRLGKKAIVLGGATQILFGIRGTRWESFPPCRPLMNENWVRPLKSEVPNNFEIVEGGCYW